MKYFTVFALAVVIFAVCIYDVSAKPGDYGKYVGKDIGKGGENNGAGKDKGGKDNSDSSSSESDEGNGKSQHTKTGGGNHNGAAKGKGGKDSDDSSSSESDESDKGKGKDNDKSKGGKKWR